MKMGLIAALFFISSFASGAPSGEVAEGMSPEALAAADDTPSECVRMDEVKLASGESVAAYAKRRGIGPSSAAQPGPKPKSAEAVGAKALSGDPVLRRRIIDGPAHLRDSPNGKILFTFESGHTVLLLAQAKDWFLIRSYHDRPCDSGWTHRKNILPYK